MGKEKKLPEKALEALPPARGARVRGLEPRVLVPLDAIPAKTLKQGKVSEPIDQSLFSEE